MKTIFSLATAAAMGAAPLAADVTQAEVVGASSDKTYSVQLRGSDGALYNCREGMFRTAAGKPARACYRTIGFLNGTEDDLLAVGLVTGIMVLGIAASGGSAAAVGVAVGSDERLKTDIRRVGTTVKNLPLYQFRYKGQPKVFEGVMAQDVQRVMPEAVGVMANGYLGVRYDMLGIEMRQVK